MGRGVRTVQRWERMGLPVRRLSQGHRAPVVADSRDIDRWLQSAQAHGFNVRQSNEQLLFRGALLTSIQQARLLRDELVRLRDSQQSNLAKLIASIARLEKICTPTDYSAPPARRARKNSPQPSFKASRFDMDSHGSGKG